MPETQPVHIEWTTCSEYLEATARRSRRFGQSSEYDATLYTILIEKFSRSRLWNQAYRYHSGNESFHLHPLKTSTISKTYPPIDEQEKEAFYAKKQEKITAAVKDDDERLTASLTTYLMYQRAVSVYVMNSITDVLSDKTQRDPSQTSPQMYQFHIGFAIEQRMNELRAGRIPEHPRDMKKHLEEYYPQQLKNALIEEITQVRNTLDKELFERFYTLESRHQTRPSLSPEEVKNHFILYDRQFTTAPESIPIADNHTTCPAVNYSRYLRDELISRVQMYWQENGIIE